MDAQTRCRDSGSVLLLRCGGATFAFHHVGDDDDDDDDDDDALEVVALLLGHKLSLAWIQVSGSLKQKVHQFFIPAFTGFLQIYVLFVNLQFVSQLFEWTVTIYETILHENKSLCLLCHTKTINLSLAIESLADW